MLVAAAFLAGLSLGAAFGLWRARKVAREWVRIEQVADQLRALYGLDAYPPPMPTLGMRDKRRERCVR